VSTGDYLKPPSGMAPNLPWGFFRGVFLVFFLRGDVRFFRLPSVGAGFLPTLPFFFVPSTPSFSPFLFARDFGLLIRGDVYSAPLSDLATAFSFSFLLFLIFSFRVKHQDFWVSPFPSETGTVGFPFPSSPFGFSCSGSPSGVLLPRFFFLPSSCRA